MSSPRRASPGFADVRMRGFQDRTEVQDVLRLIDERVPRLPAEAVPVAQAAGRVLTADVVAEVAVPGFDRAAMDGYALRAEETFGAGPFNGLDAARGKFRRGNVDPGGERSHDEPLFAENSPALRSPRADESVEASITPRPEVPRV